MPKLNRCVGAVYFRSTLPPLGVGEFATAHSQRTQGLRPSTSLAPPLHRLFEATGDPPGRNAPSSYVSLTTTAQCRVLMVGAGGIGCELLKNLVLTGFGEIHIVDLDTIDLSNLNRQFLFRHEHIKKSKALVCLSSIESMS